MAANSDYLGSVLIALFEKAALQFATDDGDAVVAEDIRITQVEYLGASYFTRNLSK